MIVNLALRSTLLLMPAAMQLVACAPLPPRRSFASTPTVLGADANWPRQPAANAQPVASSQPKQWMVGTELDLVPFLLDGWYASAIAGLGHWRARYVLTNATTPGFVTPSGFADNELDVQAYIVDYYFREGFAGWWIGPGLESWDGEVRQESTGERRSYETWIATLGGGYTFRFSDHFYLNPWLAVHVPIGGDKEVAFPGDTFDVRVTAEASIKFGINF